jgi:lipopolysaccharide transport system ATP-binding protein
MSSEIAIRVTNLSKCYQIYDNPRDRLKQFIVPKIKRAVGRETNNYYREFWALRDVSLEVKRGETLGILGRNGSGKSTLLQMICGTLTPTTGTVETSGRVAALLELGAGFNPEFTGRENVYLNAAILGLNQSEIDAKFEEIAAFADIGDFINLPVKTYSSGMYIRLAFSVQIMVDPDILIIDEALAVGDARFQLKCFQRFETLKRNGTTIVFVTHSIEAIRTFCDNGLVLNNGAAIFYGDSKAAAVKYYQTIFPEEISSSDSLIDGVNSKQEHENILACESATCTLTTNSGSATTRQSEYCLEVKPETAQYKKFGIGGAKIEWIKIYGITTPNIFGGGESFRIQCRYSWDRDFLHNVIEKDGVRNDVSLGVALADEKGQYIFGCNGYDAGIFIDSNETDSSILEIDFTMPYLKSGNYFLTTAISIGTMENHVQLKWYDYFIELKCISIKKNVYGVCHLDYQMKRIK